jgi:hypothetical protein
LEVEGASADLRPDVASLSILEPARRLVSALMVVWVVVGVIVDVLVVVEVDVLVDVLVDVKVGVGVLVGVFVGVLVRVFVGIGVAGAELLSLAVPFEPSFIIGGDPPSGESKKTPYRLTANGRVMRVIQSSQWLPISTTPGVI